MEGNPKLDRGRFHGLEFQRQDHVAIIPSGLSAEQVTKPEFWAHVAQLCRPFGRIEARAEDGTWIAELVIKEVGRQFLAVQMLQFYALTTADVAQTQTQQQVLRVAWRGQHHKWCVERISDGARIDIGKESREAAETWAREHMKALAR